MFNLISLVVAMLLTSTAISQEMGVNFNESLFYAEDVTKINSTKTTWVRGFFDFFPYYNNPERLTDVNDQLEDFLNLQKHGFKTILNIKWNFHTRSIPDTTGSQIANYNDFLQQFLNRVWGKIDIIVVGNEPFIESIKEERNTKLPPFYQYMCNRVNEFRVGKENTPIYFGSFNKLYATGQRTAGVNEMLEFVKNTLWMAGIDLHIHHKNNSQITSMYGYANDRIRADQKVLITEFSLVWWWKDYINNEIPSNFASKYNYPTTQKVHEYIHFALNNRRPKEEWHDFLRMSTWFEEKKNYLWESYQLFSQYESFHVATYSYRINWGKNFNENSVPWLLNNLIAGVTVEDDPLTGNEQFNYGFIDDFFKIQEYSGSTSEAAPLDSTKMFMQFYFDESLEDASSEEIEFNLNIGTETYTSGKFGSALNFDNTVFVTNRDSIINVGSESSTLGVWVKINQSTAINNEAMTILHQKDPEGGAPPGRIMMEILNGDIPSTFESGSRAQSTEAIDLDTWHHVAVVHNKNTNTKHLYIDGVFNAAASFGSEQSVGPFVMGAFKTEDKAFLIGSLDELFWTKEILTLEQIKLLMNVGLANSFKPQETHFAQIKTNENILVYPTPARNYLSLTKFAINSGNSFQIINIAGKEITPVQNITTNEINIEDLPNGNYIFKIFSGNSIHTQKFSIIL